MEDKIRSLLDLKKSVLHKISLLKDFYASRFKPNKYGKKSIEPVVNVKIVRMQQGLEKLRIPETRTYRVLQIWQISRDMNLKVEYHQDLECAQVKLFRWDKFKHTFIEYMNQQINQPDGLRELAISFLDDGLVLIHQEVLE